MSIIETIQKKFYLNPLLRRQQEEGNNKAFVPLNKAKAIGIICDFRNSVNQPIAVNFYKQIYKNSISYKVLLFISEKRDSINLYDYEKLFKGADVYVVCPEDFNFTKAPKKTIYSRFTESRYDIIFRLDLEPLFEMDVIILSAKAKMFAGAQHKDIPYLDFRIELSANAGLHGLSSNLIEYLNSLNSKEKNTAHENSKSTENTIF